MKERDDSKRLSGIIQLDDVYWDGEHEVEAPQQNTLSGSCASQRKWTSYRHEHECSQRISAPKKLLTGLSVILASIVRDLLLRCGHNVAYAVADDG